MYVETTIGVEEFISQDNKYFSFDKNTGWEKDYVSAMDVCSNVAGVRMKYYSKGHEIWFIVGLKELKSFVGKSPKTLVVRNVMCDSYSGEELKPKQLVKIFREKDKVLIIFDNQWFYFKVKELKIAIENIERSKAK